MGLKENERRELCKRDSGQLYGGNVLEGKAETWGGSSKGVPRSRIGREVPGETQRPEHELSGSEEERATGRRSSSLDQVRSGVRGCDGRGWADAVAGACTRSVLSTAQ